MMGSDGAAAAVAVAAADQDPCSSMASLGAWAPAALTVAWQILETPLDFVGWGKPCMTEASSESLGATWHPVVGGEVDHHPQRSEVTAASVAAQWCSYHLQAGSLEAMAARGDASSSCRDTEIGAGV